MYVDADGKKCKKEEVRLSVLKKKLQSTLNGYHESDRITVAKCLDMMEEKDISKEEMISNIESAKEELFTLYNEKINIIINELEK